MRSSMPLEVILRFFFEHKRYRLKKMKREREREEREDHTTLFSSFLSGVRSQIFRVLIIER